MVFVSKKDYMFGITIEPNTKNEEFRKGYFRKLPKK